MPKKLLIVSGLLIMFFGLILPSSGIAGVPNDVCAECHDEVAEAFTNTAHSVFLSDNAESCEACHGSATMHADGGDPADIVNPGKADQFGDLLCLNCHKSHKFDNWKFSSHNNADITCSSCHKIHVTAEKSAKKTTSNLCLDCHTNVRAELSMPSHHPIAEGMLECADCHGPHGEPAKLTSDNSGRELCFSCHAEKEGPFVYEHAPVNEDCMLCHNAHGSVADKLLKQNESSLCLSCHPMHFHVTAYSVDGSFTPPQATDRTSISNPDSWKEGMLTNCTRCHSEIHGSDLPSQATSTLGNTLTR